MHLTADQTTAVVGALVSLVVAGAAWLRARMAHQAAAKADAKAQQALNGTAAGPGAGQACKPLP